MQWSSAVAIYKLGALWDTAFACTELRAAQGHHRLPNPCVKKYGRDDVWPQLLCQAKILKRVRNGWCPHVPLNRGLNAWPVAEDTAVLASLRKESDHTDSESEDEAQGRSAQLKDSSSDSYTGESDESVESVETEYMGPWLLNARTGWYHRTLKVETHEGRDESQWCLACRPSTVLSAWYELRDMDPGLKGFQPCGHWGCFPKWFMP